MKKTSLVALTIIAIQFTGCSKKPDASTSTSSPTKTDVATQDTQPAAKTVVDEPKANAAAEEYQEVANPYELGLDVQVAASRVEFGNNPGGPVQGSISSLTIGGKELALSSPEIVDGYWITTKDYGKIKIASGALGRGLVIYLKPSQKASLMKLYEETKSSK
jgi:hypothetical protein